jgi:hypothetical protein
VGSERAPVDARAACGREASRISRVERRRQAPPSY